jgi:hypothetical protein
MPREALRYLLKRELVPSEVSEKLLAILGIIRSLQEAQVREAHAAGYAGGERKDRNALQ